MYYKKVNIKVDEIEKTDLINFISTFSKFTKEEASKLKNNELLFFGSVIWLWNLKNSDISFEEKEQFKKNWKTKIEFTTYKFHHETDHYLQKFLFKDLSLAKSEFEFEKRKDWEANIKLPNPETNIKINPEEDIVINPEHNINQKEATEHNKKVVPALAYQVKHKIWNQKKNLNKKLKAPKSKEEKIKEQQQKLWEKSSRILKHHQHILKNNKKGFIEFLFLILLNGLLGSYTRNKSKRYVLASYSFLAKVLGCTEDWIMHLVNKHATYFGLKKINKENLTEDENLWTKHKSFGWVYEFQQLPNFDFANLNEIENVFFYRTKIWKENKKFYEIELKDLDNSECFD